MDTFRAIELAEGFGDPAETEQEIIDGWQYLLDTGLCWQLQGWYGRTVTDLINAGIITRSAHNEAN